ncbi:hypothetical protein FPOAC1_011621 [Fusarium poae]|uniref:hypothetical protein n=1 Tax=Fusarium poae TaxID=36050 RepID=UPI001CEB9AF2|nr:hypothetical protein FPOAC1_011621 [Fusarium poae]KAG8666803.1 hypothetical protein FPOAC1_011621 [Fusarium poae]
MRLLRTFLAGLVALPMALTFDDKATAVLSTLPKCAAKCLITNLLTSTCELEDVQCTCMNTELQQQVEICVLSNCTVTEALSTKNTTMTFCGAPVRNGQAPFVSLNDTMGVISGIFCLLRYITKIAYKVPLGLDDLFMLITMLISIACITINTYGLGNSGFGRDLWTLTPTQITDFGRWFYVMAVFYFADQAFLKLTMIFFFLRIFPSENVRKILWITTGITITVGIMYIFLAIFQCRPISYFWTKWDMEHEGSCASINGITWSNGAINIAMDFWIMAIPISQLKKMNMGWGKKLLVGGMFSVGIFVTIMSILRLYATIVAGMSHTNNASWEYLAMSKWSTIEINVGIWCACMPSLRIMFSRLCPKLLGTSKRYLKYGSGKNGKSLGTESSPVKYEDCAAKVINLRPERIVSVTRIGKDSQYRPGIDPSGITCDRTYDVQYGYDDETYLVHMKQMDNKSTNSYQRSDGDFSLNEVAV